MRSVPIPNRDPVGVLFGVPALAGPYRLKAGLRTDGTTQTGSWSQCTIARPRGLSMNLVFGVPALAGPGRLKAGHRLRSGSLCPANRLTPHASRLRPQAFG